MNGKMIIELLIIQMIIILSLVFSIIFLLILRKNIRLQDKFSKYTINPIKENKISLFDKIEEIFTSIVLKHAKILEKSSFFKKYATKYEKHLSFEELKTRDGMYLISIKFIIGYVFIFLYLLSQTLQYKNITLFGMLICFLFGFYILNIVLNITYRKRRKEVEEDLLKAIIIMNNTFKSGRSTMQAVEIVKDELSGAISDEFKKIYLDISYGLSIETVFERFYERIQLDDAKYISSSLTLLNKTGGNIVKVFESIEKEFYNRKKINNELKSMTSASKYVVKILLFTPFIEYVLIYLLNKDYFSPLFTTILGKLLLLLIVLFYVLYILTINKITRLSE